LAGLPALPPGLTRLPALPAGLPGLRRQEFNREEMNTLIRRLPPRSVLIGFRLLRAYTALLFSRISPA